MANIFSSSIGKKLVMSISGAFLMVFLLLHMSVNLGLLAGPDAYNIVCHFMDTNPFIQIMQPVLALGFLIHIVYAVILTWSNMKARPVKYAVGTKSKASSWASRNMFVLGLIVLGFLCMHLTQFFVKMKLTGDPLLAPVMVDGTEMHNVYALVSTLFKTPLYSIIYIVWIWSLWFHLCHGFWSAFQTIGVNNQTWIPRLQVASYIYATVIAIGFTMVPLWFVLGFGV